MTSADTDDESKRTLGSPTLPLETGERGVLGPKRVESAAGADGVVVRAGECASESPHESDGVLNASQPPRQPEPQDPDAAARLEEAWTVFAGSRKSVRVTSLESLRSSPASDVFATKDEKSGCP